MFPVRGNFSQVKQGVSEKSSVNKRSSSQISSEEPESKRTEIADSTLPEVESAKGDSSNRLSDSMNILSTNNRAQLVELSRNNQDFPELSVQYLMSKCNDLSSFLDRNEIYNNINYYCFYFEGDYVYKNLKDNKIIRIKDPCLLDIEKYYKCLNTDVAKDIDGNKIPENSDEEVYLQEDLQDYQTLIDNSKNDFTKEKFTELINFNNRLNVILTDLNKLNEQKEVITIKSDFAGMESKEELKSDENVKLSFEFEINNINQELQNLENDIKLYMLQANGIKIPYDDIDLVNGLNLSFDEIEYFCKHKEFFKVADTREIDAERKSEISDVRQDDGSYVKALKKVKIDKDTTIVMPIYTTKTKQGYQHEEGFVNDKQKEAILDLVYRKMYTNLCENRYIDVIKNTDQHAAAQIAHRFSGRDSLEEFMTDFRQNSKLYMSTQGKYKYEKNSLENCAKMIHNITYGRNDNRFGSRQLGQLSYMMRIPNQHNKCYQLVIGKEGNVEPLSEQALVNNMTIITFTERNWSDGFQDPVEALMLDKTDEEKRDFLDDYEFKQEMSYRWDIMTDSIFRREYQNKEDFISKVYFDCDKHTYAINSSGNVIGD